MVETQSSPGGFLTPQPRAFMSWRKLIRVAAAKPRSPMKKTERQKRLEDLVEVQDIGDMIELEVVVDRLMVKVELSGVLTRLKHLLIYLTAKGPNSCSGIEALSSFMCTIRRGK